MASSSSSSSSLVTMAKTAIHSAAAKAEKVLTDMRIDLKHDREKGDGLAGKETGDQLPAPVDLQETGKSADEEDKHSKWKPLNLGKKHDWQNSLRNFGIGRKDLEEKANQVPPDNSMNDHEFHQNHGEIPDKKENDPCVLEDGRKPPVTPSIPPVYVLKNLASAIIKAKNFKSVTDFLENDADSPPIKDKLGLSFSVVKSIVVREKDKLNHEMCRNLEISSAVQVLFHSEGNFLNGKEGSRSEWSLVASIHGAPPGSFLVKVSEISGSFKSLRKMAFFWHNVVAELKRLWSEEKPIPHMPLDENPDLDCCRLHQQLQVINCCIARKLRRISESKLMDSIAVKTLDSNPVDSVKKFSGIQMVFAKDKSGVHVPRLGASNPSKNLTMLETGEQIYSPMMQEGPVFTEELIKENEEFIMRTGSIGAGCSQLLSDMQAFKAANPGCILEDFIRWYSPPDWKEFIDNDSCSNEDGSSSGGRLSGRMQREGNLWRELWEAARPLPAAKQAPLFDEDLAVDDILTSMESISPSELLEQLFLSMISSSFAIVESILERNCNIPKLFYDCKEYINLTCHNGLQIDSIDDICKVYETVEAILSIPEANWASDERDLEEPRSRLKKLHLPFIGKDRFILSRSTPKDQKKSDGKNTSIFSNLMDGKTSLFTKKHPSHHVDSHSESH